MQKQIKHCTLDCDGILKVSDLQKIESQLASTGKCFFRASPSASLNPDSSPHLPSPVAPHITREAFLHFELFLPPAVKQIKYKSRRKDDVDDMHTIPIEPSVLVWNYLDGNKMHQKSCSNRE